MLPITKNQMHLDQSHRFYLVMDFFRACNVLLVIRHGLSVPYELIFLFMSCYDR